jgi:hypothetical protein
MRRGELRSLSYWTPWVALLLTPWGVAFRFELISGFVLLISCAAALGFLLAQGIRARLRGPSLLTAALRLDAEHELKGRLSAALSYAGVFGAQARASGEDPFVALVVQESHSLGDLAPEQAVPFERPSGLIWAGAMLSLFVLLVLFPLRAVVVVEQSNEPEIEKSSSAWIAADDAELLQRSALELSKAAESKEAAEAAERYNELVLRAVSGEIGQAEAFRLAAELEADLEASAALAQEFSDGLKSRGEKLRERKITRAVGEALSDGRVKDAEDALRKLSERLASEASPISQKELEELRSSLEELRKATETEISKDDKEAASDDSNEEQSLKKERERLLKKKNDGSASKSELQQLDKAERQLKRLSRKRKAAEAKKTLSELDKQLAEAARDIAKEAKKSGQFLDQAADTLKQGQKQQLSDQEKREVLKQLKALKERLRRQNQESEQEKRLREFQKRARGQTGQGSPEKEGKPGGEQGEKRGLGPVSLGPEGIPIPGAGNSEGPPDAQGRGEKPGQAHDPIVQGAATKLPGAGAEDKTAVAQDSGDGQSASETILSVAEEGFKPGSYERLFHEYHTVFEEVMEKEHVPQGRQSHVMRYFELIRPRGDAPVEKGKP